jgi:hypothetical protein
MPIRQQIFALLVCIGVFIFIIELVRERRLREEYSVLWLATSTIMFFLVVKYDWLEALTAFIGAGLVTTTLFICAMIFLMLVAVQFSIKISRLTNQVKDLVQDNALLRTELKQCSRPGPGAGFGDGEKAE